MKSTRLPAPVVTSPTGALVRTAAALLACSLASCASEDTPKAWNALATCIAGADAVSPIGVRVQKLRLVQLGNAAGEGSAPKDAWPKRCNDYADALFAALPTSGESAILRGKMREKLHCTEAKGTCTLPNDGTLLSTTTALWDAAKSSGLTTEVAANMPPVTAAPAPLLDAKSWKPLSSKPVKISGPVLTSDGRGVLVMKAAEGRARPTACEFSDGFAKLRIVEANASVPELPTQSIEVVSDAKGIFAAGLTDDGLVAYDLQSGEKSDVRGRSRHLLRDGLVVEKGAKDDLTQEPPRGLPGQAPKGAKGKKAKPKPTVKEEGYVAVELNAGKASKDIKLPIKEIVSEPIAVANQVVFMKPAESSAELVPLSVTRGRIRAGASIKGAFSGTLRSCQRGSDLAVAAFGPRSGQNNAKPTAGDGKTQFSVALFRNNTWSKALEATIPFDRAFESELVCSKDGASLVWVRNAEGGAQVGRVDCSADACKVSDAKLPGVESKWWWGAGPLGDKVFLLWRAPLGETRLRVGSIAELAAGKDTLVFDSPDFNGPSAAEVSSLLTPEAALLVFRNEQPVALRLSPDAALRVIAP